MSLPTRTAAIRLWLHDHAGGRPHQAPPGHLHGRPCQVRFFGRTRPPDAHGGFPHRDIATHLTSKSASFILSTVNTACTFLLALRVAYSKASTTPHWPTHLSARHGSDTDRRGHLPTKRGYRSPDARARRDSKGRRTTQDSHASGAFSARPFVR